MESILGLPAHPLLVHAPVVLVPLATLFALVVAVVPRLGRRTAWALAAAAAVCLIATQLAVSSGYAFDDLVAGAVDTDEHRGLGETTRNLVLLFFVSAAARAGLGALTVTEDRRWLVPATRVSSAVATLSSIMATIWMVRTGHEGARLVWDGVLSARLL